RVQSSHGANEIILALHELGGHDSEQRRALLYRIASSGKELCDTARIRREHRGCRVVIVGNLALGCVLGLEARQLHRYNFKVFPLRIGRTKGPRRRRQLSLFRFGIGSCYRKVAQDRTDAEYPCDEERYAANNEQLRPPRQSASER